MRRTIKAGLIFVVSVAFFVTIPSLLRIQRLNAAIGQSKNTLRSDLVLPVIDSYETTRSIEELIAKNSLDKKSLFFHTDRYEDLKLYEYELHLQGSYEQIEGFVESAAELTGVRFQSVAWDRVPESKKFSLQLKVVFLSE